LSAIDSSDASAQVVVRNSFAIWSGEDPVFRLHAADLPLRLSPYGPGRAETIRRP
jgi:hypothetical protein